MTTQRLSVSVSRGARFIVTAFIIGTSIGLTLFFLGLGEVLGLVPKPDLRDWQAYWDAAIRLRDGAELYPLVSDPNAETTFRYAPWFAAMWIPLTFLPRTLVSNFWIGLMGLASILAVLPLIRARARPAILLAALFAPYLAQATAQGNIQPVLIALLVNGVDRKWGPIAIGVAASLKLFPILYAGQYALHRQWGRLAVASFVAAILVSPVLFFDLTHYPLEAGPTGSIWLLGPLPWALGLILGIGAAVSCSRTSARWFATSLAVVLASPRLLQYDLSYLLVTGRDLLARRASERIRKSPR